MIFGHNHLVYRVGDLGLLAHLVSCHARSVLLYIPQLTDHNSEYDKSNQKENLNSIHSNKIQTPILISLINSMNVLDMLIVSPWVIYLASIHAAI